jgi:hypothetical protein
MTTSHDDLMTRPVASSAGLLRTVDDVEAMELGANRVLFPVRGAETGGTLHSVANRGAAPARFIVILSPSGYEGFWREMAALRLRVGSAPDGQTVLALQRKYQSGER